MVISIKRNPFKDQIVTMCNMIDLILNLGNSSDKNVKEFNRREVRFQAIQFHRVPY